MKVYVVSHKYVEVPCDEVYVPLFVGAEQNARGKREANWQYDDTCGSSLSGKTNTIAS